MKTHTWLAVGCLFAISSPVALLAADPPKDAGNWGAGKVKVDGQLLDVADAGKRLASDPKRVAYDKKRDALVDTADNHRELARWCQKQRLNDEARVHWLKVLEYDRQDAEAIAGLGLGRYEGRLLTAAEIKGEKAQAVARRQAWHKWRPIVARWRSAIQGSSTQQAEAATNELKQLKDPQALRVLEDAFASDAKSDKNNRLNLLLVETAGRFDTPEATQILLRRALRTHAEVVCLMACAELQKRPMHAYVPLLVSLMPNSLKTKYNLVLLPTGAVVHEHHVEVDGPQGAITFTYESTVQPSDWLFGQRLSPVAMARGASNAAAIERTAEAIESEAMPLRERIKFVLRTATGFESVDDPQLWMKQLAEHYGWKLPEKPAPSEQKVWTHEFYYPLPPKPTQVRAAAAPREPVAPEPPPKFPWMGPGGLGTSRGATFGHNCFAAGTPVVTANGEVPIESIRPGQLVLARDMKTGELAFKTVQLRTLCQSPAMIRMQIGSESITTTPGHPFWVADRGWVVAKHLEVGDRMVGLTGPAQVDKLEMLPAAEVYNLVVTDFATYYVGNAGLLVHDDTGIAANPDATERLAARP